MPVQRRLCSRLIAFSALLPAAPRRAIRVMPSTRLFATAATVSETQDLVSWIEAGGGRCESLTIATDVQNGQTLIASRDIRKGKQLVLLPSSRQLKAFSAEPGLQRLVDLVPADLWAARLAIPIVAERSHGTKSRFWPYLQTLPKGISGLPIFFKPDEVAALQYAPLIQQVNLRCRWLLKFCSDQLSDSKQASLFNNASVDVNLLGWGMGVASSRAFKIGQAKQPTMLPLIDLCNHSFSPNCRLETSADGTVRLMASNDIPSNKALVINYGDLSNTSLLQDYGFIVDSNPHDNVDMQISVDHIQVAQVLAGAALPGELAEWETKWLEQIGIGSSGCSMKLARSSPMFDWRLVAAARVLCASSEQDLLGLDMRQLGDLDASLQPDVEAKALKTLAAMCAQLISAMGTKTEDDRGLLRSDGLTDNMKLAINYRIQLKLFIQAALALVLNKLKRLQK